MQTLEDLDNFENNMKNHKLNCQCCICKAKRGETFGKNNSFYNKNHSLKTRKKISKSRKNKYKNEKAGNYKDGRTLKEYYCITENCNNKITYQTWLYGNKRCHSCFQIEELNHRFGKIGTNYIDGRTSLTVMIRNLLEYNNWRKEIYERDNFICQKCGYKEGKILEAHHKKEFSIILSEFLQQYSQFSPLEDKETLVRLSLSWKDFWDIDNGITLCRDCHNKIKKGNELCQK